MDLDTINQYLSIKTPYPTWNKIQHGGHYRGLTIEDLIFLSGKWFVFHRQIHDRDPEILCKVEIPKGEKKLIKFFKYNLDSLEDKYEHIMNLMTEVQDIKNYFKLHKNMEDNEEILLLNRLFSYRTHIAVYNPKNNTVETLYFGFSPALSKEMMIDSSKTKQITQMILDHCSFLDETKKDDSEWDSI